MMNLMQIRRHTLAAAAAGGRSAPDHFPLRRLTTATVLCSEMHLKKKKNDNTKEPADCQT